MTSDKRRVLTLDIEKVDRKQKRAVTWSSLKILIVRGSHLISELVLAARQLREVIR